MCRCECTYGASMAMFEDEIIYDEVYVPPQYEEQPINSEGDGLKLVCLHAHTS